MSQTTEPAGERDPWTEAIAGNVRAEAARRQISRYDIAKHLDISEATTSRRMSGASPWSTPEIVALAKLFDCPVTTLYDVEPKPTS
jgi:hypothetical protein